MNNNFALIYPTLVVGLGGTGAKSTRVLKRMVERYFRSRGCEVPPIIGYLVVDTEDLRNNPGDEPLAQDEYVNLGSDFDANRVVEFMEQTEGLYESIREWWTSNGHDAGPPFVSRTVPARCEMWGVWRSTWDTNNS